MNWKQVVKDKKIRCFYTEERRAKPSRHYVRHFIHTKNSGGFWAHLRDAMQSEKLTNGAVGRRDVRIITVGYNPRILELWERLTIIDEEGKTYNIKEKPDEYDHDKGDMKIAAYAFLDEHVYTEDEDVYAQ